MEFPQKVLEVDLLLLDLAKPLLGIFPKDSKSYYRDICSSISLPFSSNSEKMKQGWILMCQWITKIWRIDTIEFYAAVKKKENRKFSGK